MTIARSKTIWVASALFGVLGIVLAQAIPDPAFGNAAGFLSLLCIATSVGLAFGARWARHLSQALLLVIVAAWFYMLITFSIPNWPFTGVTSSIMALLPGAALVIVCLGVLAALRRHFRKHAI